MVARGEASLGRACFIRGAWAGPGIHWWRAISLTRREKGVLLGVVAFMPVFSGLNLLLLKTEVKGVGEEGAEGRRQGFFPHLSYHRIIQRQSWKVVTGHPLPSFYTESLFCQDTVLSPPYEGILETQ